MIARFLSIADSAADLVLGSVHRAIGSANRCEVSRRADPSLSQRFVVICVHERSRRPDMARLLAALGGAGFYRVLVTSNSAHEQYADLSEASIDVSHYGRDFSAYKAGLAFIGKAATAQPSSTIAFLNDSVWYFQKYQTEIVERLLASTERGELCVGGFIADEVPHATGWLFAMPFDEAWRGDIDRLFAPHFVSRSRRYHIRNGEHRILPTMQRATEVTSLSGVARNPAIATCYEALTLGSACFYLKADAQLRTNAPSNHLADFLAINAEPRERIEVLQWIAARSAALAADWRRASEMSSYRKRHFEGASQTRVA